MNLDSPGPILRAKHFKVPKGQQFSENKERPDFADAGDGATFPEKSEEFRIVEKNR